MTGGKGRLLIMHGLSLSLLVCAMWPALLELAGDGDSSPSIM